MGVLAWHGKSRFFRAYRGIIAIFGELMLSRQNVRRPMAGPPVCYGRSGRCHRRIRDNPGS
eukprot:4368545-Pyramimonas_sp.AAC.4